MKPTIAFVGVGKMGANMARHLTDLGYEITALYDSHAPLATELAAEIKSTAVASLKDVTESADVVITVVTDDAAMREIFSTDSADSLIGTDTDASGTTFINCATLSPAVHQEVEKTAQAAGAQTLEASMASSITQARNGTLYLMIGGEESVFEAQKPLLEDLSTALRYVGTAGKAAQVKALVNMVMNINTAALAEGLGLGDALGLDLNMLCEIFAQTGANSRVLETDAEDMLLRDHECYFSAAHAAKDSGIANDLGEQAGISIPLSKATQEQYQRMIDLGLGELDKSGIAELTFKGRTC